MAKAKKLKSGNWRVLVYEYTDENKKRHYKSITAPTKKEAEYQAAEYALNRKDTSYEDLTLQEVYERYISSKSSVLSPATIAGYERSKKNHFQQLMPMKLSKITAKHIQTAVNEMAADHSPKTVRNAHGLLHSVIKSYIPNFEFSTTLPQKLNHNIQFLRPRILTPYSKMQMKKLEYLYFLQVKAVCAGQKYVL